MAKKERVLVMGASDKPDRYSNMALRLLVEKGYEAVPVHPRLSKIDGLPVFNKLDDVGGTVDTVTMYVGPDAQADMIAPLLALRPARIIANPGAECDAMRSAAAERGIDYVEACTLVMLKTDQF